MLPVMPLRPGVGMQRQGVDRARQQLSQRGIDPLVARDLAQTLKLCANQGHLEMGLGVRGHAVLVAFIDDCQVVGGEGRRQLSLYVLLNCHRDLPVKWAGIIPEPAGRQQRPRLALRCGSPETRQAILRILGA